MNTLADGTIRVLSSATNLIRSPQDQILLERLPDQGDDVMMQFQGQAKKERQHDRCQSSCNVSRDVTPSSFG
jgi:hypothetical protein